MAAALLDHHAGGRVVVRSAGSDSADALNPDVVITMGCGDACPIYPGKRYEDWQLPDPAGQPIEVVRGIRDQIDGRVRQLLAELGR
jgi:arsenate reductase (thioredoxin)